MLPRVESYFRRWAACFTPPESFSTTTSRRLFSRPCQQRRKLRPMRPKPLIATLSFFSLTVTCLLPFPPCREHQGNGLSDPCDPPCTSIKLLQQTLTGRKLQRMRDPTTRNKDEHTLGSQLVHSKWRKPVTQRDNLTTPRNSPHFSRTIWHVILLWQTGRPHGTSGTVPLHCGPETQREGRESSRQQAATHCVQQELR